MLGKLTGDSPAALVEYLSAGILQEKDTVTELPTMQQLYDAGDAGYQWFHQPTRRFFKLVHSDYSFDKEYEAWDVTQELDSDTTVSVEYFNKFIERLKDLD